MVSLNYRRHRWLVVALLFFATVLNYVDRQTLSILGTTLRSELRLSEKAPGIVLAFEIEKECIGEHFAQSITLVSPLQWSQVQCALIAFQGDDELAWFATQEIEIHLAEWK